MMCIYNKIDTITHKIKRKKLYLYYIVICLFFVSYQVLGQSNQQDNQEQTVPGQLQKSQLGQEQSAMPYSRLLFSSEGYINALSPKIQTLLLKGTTVIWDVLETKRYAAVVQSSTLDTVIRLEIDTISVYRDLYLGEQAGIVFSTPHNTSAKISAFANTVLFSKDTDIETGTYSIKIYEVEHLPKNIETLPYTTTSSVTEEHSIALRKAREYSITLEEDTRVYVRLSSDEFDPLLELSDTYGRSVISDDWQGDEAIITLLSPQTAKYFITVSSFDGMQVGNYSLTTHATKNKKVLEDSNNISQQDTKLLSRYFKEYSIDMEEETYHALEINAIDGDITMVFSTDTKQTIVEYDIKKSETISIPLYASKRGKYLILVFSSSSAIVNYTLNVYE